MHMCQTPSTPSPSTLPKSSPPPHLPSHPPKQSPHHPTTPPQVSLLQPDSPEGAANLGSSYKDAARHDAAIAAYRRALALRGDFPEAFANLVHSLQCVCEWGDRGRLFQRLEAEVRRDLAAGRLPSVQPFHAMAYPFSAELALSISRQYAEQCALAAARLALPELAHPAARRLGAGERLRVAYVSSDFGNHPLSHLMGSVFGMHDRRRVEVFCYGERGGGGASGGLGPVVDCLSVVYRSLCYCISKAPGKALPNQTSNSPIKPSHATTALSPPDGSEWRARIESEAEHFLDCSAWSSGDVARKISADNIHVAVNLNGYTKGARNEIFALRPAPVQASYMGFPATTGGCGWRWGSRVGGFGVGRAVLMSWA
jgi:protein O-GlcNAc transferase